MRVGPSALAKTWGFTGREEEAEPHPPCLLTTEANAENHSFWSAPGSPLCNSIGPGVLVGTAHKDQPRPCTIPTEQGMGASGVRLEHHQARLSKESEENTTLCSKKH